MGTEDMRRQRPNVERMRLLGAEVSPVEAGARTLKEAVSAAIRDWVANVDSTHYVIGSVVGPSPYPALVRDLQRVIGNEAREQALALEGRLPARVIACVGGGSNAIGTFYAFLDDDVELIGIEAGGEGLDGDRHGASLVAGRTGVLHGTMSSVLADSEGQILEAHSVSAGLDYPGVGPEHAQLRDSGRARYAAVGDDAALRAFRELARLEGILPALEPAHAIAWLLEDSEAHPGGDPAARAREPSAHVTARPSGSLAEHAAGFDVLCLSGRGDKDLAEVLERTGALDGD
jgi:tryptophan synthase beta chain